MKMSKNPHAKDHSRDHWHNPMDVAIGRPSQPIEGDHVEGPTNAGK